MLRPAALIAATILLLFLFFGGIAAIANRSPQMQPVGERSGAERPRAPARTAPPQSAEPTESPEPADTDRPDEPSRTPVETTERHVIHGSGSIAVTSGEVEEGERSGSSPATFPGPSRRPAP